MTANHTVKVTITSHQRILEQISIAPWAVALMLFLMTFIIPFPNQVSSWAQSSSGGNVSSAAGVVDLTRNICIEDPQSFDKGIPLTEPDSVGPSISLGCKLWDCDAASTDPSPIKMEFGLTGDAAADSVLIEFTNLPPAKNKEELIKVIAGTAVIGPRDVSFRIPLRKRVILQISKQLIDGGTSVYQNPTIKATLLPNKRFLQEHLGDPAFNPGHSWTVTLEIDQFKGKVRVNEFKALYSIRWCPSSPLPLPGPPRFDQIKLKGAPDSSNSATLMISGRSSKSECLKYRPVLGKDSIRLSNMLSKSQDCQLNEIVMFTKDRQMKIVKPEPDWTDAGGEVREILWPDKPLQVPVTFWILHKPGNIEISELKVNLLKQLKTANQFFGPENECGIEFVVDNNSFQDVTIDAEANELSDFICSTTNIRKLQAFDRMNWKHSHAINVYYVSKAPSHKDSFCGYGIFLAQTREVETLAHEFGHALGLADAFSRSVNPRNLNPVDLNKWVHSQRNLMFSGGFERRELTKGQCFRCYMERTSAIRMLGILPKDESRECTGRSPRNDCIDIGETVTNPY